LLLAWRANRLHAGGDLGFTGIPARLNALAALTGAQGALSAPSKGTVGA
jgi:hypothetical protein